MTNKVKLKYDYLMKLEYVGEVKDGLPHGDGTFNIYGELSFKELSKTQNYKETKKGEYEYLFHHTCTTQYLQALIEVSLKESKPKDFDKDCLEISIKGGFKEGLWEGRFFRIDYDFLNGKESENEETEDFEVYSEASIFENNIMVEGRIDFDDGYYFGEVKYIKSFDKDILSHYVPHNEGEYTYYKDNKRVSGIWENGKLKKTN